MENNECNYNKMTDQLKQVPEWYNFYLVCLWYAWARNCCVQVRSVCTWYGFYLVWWESNFVNIYSWKIVTYFYAKFQKTTTAKKRCSMSLYIVIKMPIWRLMCNFYLEPGEGGQARGRGRVRCSQIKDEVMKQIMILFFFDLFFLILA